MEQKITGIVALRTAQKARVRSMPKQKGQEYLDVYLAQKLIGRLERERENTELRSRRIDEDYTELSADVRKLQEEIGIGPEAPPAPDRKAAASKSKKKKMPCKMKKMDIQY